MLLIKKEEEEEEEKIKELGVGEKNKKLPNM